jgi:hypothetical protein
MKTDWVVDLRARAQHYSAREPATVGFFAPRPSVIRLCNIAIACCEFVEALDLLHDNANDVEAQHLVRVRKDRLLEALK